MELRVWVDGVQRVVCGVRLTTTCQEIVFVLAKATHQAGRFTMIERWRNNERLLSPNEQPLVTLQRWGDHMNEVEFILKKANSDMPSNNQLQQRSSQLPNLINNHEQAQQVVSSSNTRSSPKSTMQLRSHQYYDDSKSDNIYHHNNYNINRRSQTSLGPLTSSNSSVGLNSDFQLSTQKQSVIHPIRGSLSTSTLQTMSKPPMISSPNNLPSTNVLYTDEHILNSSPSSLYGQASNGYPARSESNTQQQLQIEQHTKNYPFEDLYSTINKKRLQNPPAVPAKPRVAVPMSSMTNRPPYTQLQSGNKTQPNYFSNSGSPITIYSNNIRPRHPPGYLDYLEAIARTSNGQSFIQNPQFFQQNPIPGSNKQNLSIHPNNINFNTNSSSLESQTKESISNQTSNNYCSSTQNINDDQVVHKVGTIRSRIGDPSIVINRGSAVNVRLHPSNQNHNQEQALVSITSSSISKEGHDMLKMIEEQKQVLLNQKNELDRLDNDTDYWETKHNSEQVELINRIENEIHQLEELWRENQAQIIKLENQDLEKEVQDLKFEQQRIEVEIKKQNQKLNSCELEIASCNSQIDRLQTELDRLESEVDISKTDTDLEISESDKTNADQESVQNDSNDKHVNGSILSDNECSKEPKSSDDDEDYDDSEGDLSDDFNLAISDTKLRNAKDVAYVDKRGLISGFRSLKLEKSRASDRQLESIRSSDSSLTDVPSGSSLSKDKSSNNNNVDNDCPEINGQYPGKTANNSNQYEFFMTL